MGSNFIAKLSVGAGPNPIEEIKDVVAQAALDDRQEARAIFATGANNGKAFAKAKGLVSMAVVFFPVPNGETSAGKRELDGFVADIRFLFKIRPINIPAIYGGEWADQMQGWWQLDRVQRFRRGLTIENIPGTSSRTIRATKTFAGTCSFSFWNFESDPRSVLCE